MDPREVQRLVDDTLKEHKTSMLEDMEKLLDKISGNSNLEQIDKISSILTGIPKFKRKSNEEQFKYNSKISAALESTENLLQSNKIDESKQKIAEVKELVAHRQKLIRLADGSDLGWRLVNEYESNPLADGSDDEKKILKAEARANKKMREERAKKARSARHPYKRKAPATATSQAVPVAQSTFRRPPGLCFACGKPGHWKGSQECPANSGFNNNKISNFCVNNKIFTAKDAEETDGLSLNEGISISENSPVVLENKIQLGAVSPVGRLSRHASKWSEATDSKYILDVINKGYRLPLKDVPGRAVLRNNKSARENSQFVEKEIECLLSKGIISRSEVIPHVVNPLTVAYNKKGKPRLVLDCRHINPCLHQFKIKFEDIKVAETLFEHNSFMFTFDLKGAYHHIDIFSEHRTYLGFSYSEKGQNKYYVFNSLPFGIKTAGHIFTKVLKVVVSYLRARSHKIIMFLDDGIGGDQSYELALKSSEYTKQAILEFGFLLADDKCSWTPARNVTWLGHVLDMDQNMLFISEERIQRLEALLDSSIYQVKCCEENLLPVKHLAGVVGHIISLQSVIGNKTRLMTREMFKCINSRASWNACVIVSGQALEELKFWKDNARLLNQNGKNLKHEHMCLYNVFVDASHIGYGGYIEKAENISDHSEKSISSRIQCNCLCQSFEFTPEESHSVADSDLITNLDLFPEVNSALLSPEADISGKVDNVSFLETTNTHRGSSFQTGKFTYLSPKADIASNIVSKWSPEVDTNDSITRECPVLDITHNIVQEVSPEADVRISKGINWSLEVDMKRDLSPDVDVTYDLSQKAHTTGINLTDNLKRKLDEAGIEDDVIADHMAQYLVQSKSDNTVTKYKSSFAHFEKFCEQKQLSALPALSITVAMYFTHLLDEGKSDHVISGANYGIKWAHNMNDMDDPTENKTVKLLLNTAKRIRSKPVQKKDVISSDMLQTLCSQYEGSCDMIDLRDLSMILLAYSGFMRIGEVCNLRCKDILFNSDHLVVKVVQSKTDIYRDGSEIVISKGTSSACPIDMLKRYVSQANLSLSSNDYLFKPAFRSKNVPSLIKKNKKLSYTRTRECVKAKLSLVAPDSNLGTHSLRASGASTVANTPGVSERCLKRHGRWKTDLAKDGYVKDSLEKRMSVTQVLNL